MAARADFSEKYLTPESGLPKAHNLSSVLAFSNGQSPGLGLPAYTCERSSPVTRLPVNPPAIHPAFTANA